MQEEAATQSSKGGGGGILSGVVPFTGGGSAKKRADAAEEAFKLQVRWSCHGHLHLLDTRAHTHRPSLLLRATGAFVLSADSFRCRCCENVQSAYGHS